MARGIETRLRKIEARRRPPDMLFFLVWGRDDAEIAERTEAARASGELLERDRLLAVQWPEDTPAPAPEWVHRSQSFTGQREVVLSAAIGLGRETVRDWP